MYYLYNGVPLPDINTVWTDKETYPYAVIIDWPPTSLPHRYFLFITTEPCEYSEENGYWVLDMTTKNSRCYHWYPGLSDNWKRYEYFPDKYEKPIIWTSHDLYEADGLYLAKSAPILYNPPNLYMYNGIQLPKLPKLDRETYPYAHIEMDVSTKVYHLRIHAVPIVVANDELSYTSFATDVWMNYFSGIDEWGFSLTSSNGDSERSHKLNRETGMVLVWADYDIFKADGSVYLAASDPIPVLQRIPSAMLLGFQVGQALRRMRK